MSDWIWRAFRIGTALVLLVAVAAAIAAAIGALWLGHPGPALLAAIAVLSGSASCRILLFD